MMKNLFHANALCMSISLFENQNKVISTNPLVCSRVQPVEFMGFLCYFKETTNKRQPIKIKSI